MPDGTERLLGRLDQGFTDLSKRFDAMETQNSTEHGVVQATLTDVRNDISGVKSDVRALQYRVESLEKTLSAANDKLSFSITGGSRSGQIILRGFVVIITALYGDHVTGAHAHNWIGNLFK